MSDQTIPNAKRVLSAARTYKRACRTVRAAHRRYVDVGHGLMTPLGRAYEDAALKKQLAGARLLWLVETGAPSLAGFNKEDK